MIEIIKISQRIDEKDSWKWKCEKNQAYIVKKMHINYCTIKRTVKRKNTSRQYGDQTQYLMLRTSFGE